MIYRCYSELRKLNSFEERFEYLKLSAIVGETTFGFERYLNQKFYGSKEWKEFRREIIIRDDGFDLGIQDRPIFDRIEIHHINPISIEDFENKSMSLLDPENVICTSSLTHKAIHYGDINLLPKKYEERRPFDTCPWKL